MKSGKDLELEVKKLLDFELGRGKLGLDPKQCEIFHRKSYFSKNRKRDIIFDVAVEVHRPGSSDPWLFWIWECKDEGRPVDVAEVEEFHSKLEQIGVHKVKGTMASRLGFRSGAYEYAKAMGIGLARILPHGSIIRLTEAVKVISEQSVRFGLIHPETRALSSMIYGLSTSGLGVENIEELVGLEIGEELKDG